MTFVVSKSSSRVRVLWSRVQVRVHKNLNLLVRVRDRVRMIRLRVRVLCLILLNACTGGHDIISFNSRFLNIHILQICKTRFEKHLACSFKNEEGRRYH